MTVISQSLSSSLQGDNNSNNDDDDKDIQIIQAQNINDTEEPKSWPILPPWAHRSIRSQWGQTLDILEWDDSRSRCSTAQNATEYRLANGWKGNDLIHSRSSPVRVLEYRLCHDVVPTTTTTETKTNNSSIIPLSFSLSPSSLSSSVAVPILTGIVHFTPQAESHKGYCHGGSMTSVFDDIIGWTGFCATGTCIPWSGYTVQINTKLCKPIQVNAILKIICFVEKIEGRKVWLKAFLFHPGGSNNDNVGGCDKEVLHAECEGLVILNKGVIEGLQ